MRITVSGLPGSGTTSLSRYLSERHGFTMISAGEVFRQCAKEHHMELAEFGRLAEKDPAYDKMIDARQKEIAEKKDNIIVEGRLSGWMVEKADLRIWLFAPIGCRLERIVFRDQIADIGTAKAITLEREHCEAVRYRAYYDIDINDLSIYHLILNSEHWEVNELGLLSIPRSGSYRLLAGRRHNWSSDDSETRVPAAYVLSSLLPSFYPGGLRTMTTEDIRIALVRSWDAEEIIALYRAGGWWKDEYDPAEIPRLISGSFAFVVAAEKRSGRAVGMGRVLSDGVSDAYIQDLVVLPGYRAGTWGPQSSPGWSPAAVRKGSPGSP